MGAQQKRTRRKHLKTHKKKTRKIKRKLLKNDINTNQSCMINNKVKNDKYDQKLYWKIGYDKKNNKKRIMDNSRRCDRDYKYELMSSVFFNL